MASLPNLKPTTRNPACRQGRSKLETRNSKLTHGFTLIELLIVMVLLAGAGAVSFINLVALREKQIVSYAAHLLKTELDTAHTRSVAVAQDASGNPSSWGVFVDTLAPSGDTEYRFHFGPYPDVNFFPPSVNLGSASYPVSYTKLINKRLVIRVDGWPSKRWLVSFSSLTGQAHVYKTNPASRTVGIGSDYTSSYPVNLVVKGSKWQQTVCIEANGNTYLTTVIKLTTTPQC